MHSRPQSRKDFKVGIICALSTESTAVSLVFDEFWDKEGDSYGRADGDNNQYTTGRVGTCDVVMTVLPRVGKVFATSTATGMRLSYPAIDLVFLVGVCGGVPGSESGDVLLGDVIISESIVQYDLGRQYSSEFLRTDRCQDNLGRANPRILGLLADLRTVHSSERLERITRHTLEKLQAKATQERQIIGGSYDYPGTSQDKLFQPEYHHKHRGPAVCVRCHNTRDIDTICEEAHRSSCIDLGCDETHLVSRVRLDRKRKLEQEGKMTAQSPAIHIGAVASGDTVMKSAIHRDRIARENKVIAFEMEAAGVWDQLPCIMVKGVCDYADSHKHKGWQDFAAAMAASATKAIIQLVVKTDDDIAGYNEAGSDGRAGRQQGGPNMVFNNVSGKNVFTGLHIAGGTANFTFN